LNDPQHFIKLPKAQRTRIKAYNAEQLAKLFAATTPDEYLRYLFFLRTGCREQEVQYASWRGIDLENLRYSVSDEGKRMLRLFRRTTRSLSLKPDLPTGP